MNSYNELQEQVARLRKRIDKQIVVYELEQEKLTKYEQQVIDHEQILEELLVAQNIFQTATKMMYDSLSNQLGNIITEGLKIVFPESEYSFKVAFVERRNTIECDLSLIDSKGNEYDPMKSVGGGVADFISLLLRITYVMLSPHENIIIADEPAKFIDRDRINTATQFIKKVCDDFGLELVVITHIPQMVEVAKTVYVVTKNIKGSQIRQEVNHVAR